MVSMQPHILQDQSEEEDTSVGQQGGSWEVWSHWEHSSPVNLWLWNHRRVPHFLSCDAADVIETVAVSSNHTRRDKCFRCVPLSRYRR